ADYLMLRRKALGCVLLNLPMCEFEVKLSLCVT
ncbi:MAG: hypothetical protein ACI85I_000806, partial [Arenicella sp.]